MEQPPRPALWAGQWEDGGKWKDEPQMNPQRFVFPLAAVLPPRHARRGGQDASGSRSGRTDSTLPSCLLRPLLARREFVRAAGLAVNRFRWSRRQ